MHYFYCLDYQTVEGPISEDDIRQKLAAKELSDDTLVCSEGTEVWKSLKEALSIVEKPTVNATTTIAENNRVHSVDDMRSRAERAIVTCRTRFQIELDWTRKSLELLDDLLLRDITITDSEELDIGCYFGLMIQRVTGWPWTTDEDGEFYQMDTLKKRPDGSPLRSYSLRKVPERILLRAACRANPLANMQASLHLFYDYVSK